MTIAQYGGETMKKTNQLYKVRGFHKFRFQTISLNSKFAFFSWIGGESSKEGHIIVEKHVGRPSHQRRHPKSNTGRAKRKNGANIIEVRKVRVF